MHCTLAIESDMDPLEAILRPVATLINRQIKATTPAREICEDIEGSVVAIRVRDSALATYFHIHADHISLTGQFSDEPDVVITGSLLSLGKLATPSATEAIRDGSVELHGDARVVQSFQRLLQYGKPDLEEELSNIIGDSATQQLSEFGKRLMGWGEQAGATIRQNVSEYLQEENKAVPSRFELEEFRSAVSSIRDDVARFEARLRKFEHSRSDNRSD